jgi:cell division protein FtsB
MDGPEILIPIMGILLVMIPVAGLTVGWVAKTLARIRRDSGDAAHAAALQAQVTTLQEEVESLSAEVRELRAAQDFDRKLLGEAGRRVGGAE